MKFFLETMVFVFGAVVGSFLNVCIYRMPLSLSIVTPGSRCGACKTPIAWYDNIPLVSWLLLGGKCRHCGAPFSFRYWIIEFLTAALFLGVWLKFGPNLVTLATPDGVVRVQDLMPPMIVPIYWMLIGGLIVATFIDLDHYIIPDEISLGGVAAGLVLSVAFPSLHHETVMVIGGFRSIMGIIIGSALVLWLAIGGELIFKKEAMGFGDVKFLAMIGAFLGWQAAVFTLVASSFFGAIVGILWIWLSKDRQAIAGEASAEGTYHSLDAWSLREEMDTHAMRSSIPYGPFLALGAALWIFTGDKVMEFVVKWYGLQS